MTKKHTSTAVDYAIEVVDYESVKPAPENDEIYGVVEDDEQMDALVDSIERLGLEEPLIVTHDSVIISGHRRYHACGILGLEQIPVRRKTMSHEGHPDFHRLLTEYNPQRIKRTSSLLREALLRMKDGSPTALLYDHRRSSTEVEADFMEVVGIKTVNPVSAKKRGFLRASKVVIEDLRSFWPEHYRYRNDKTSYDALVELLRQARYSGEVSMRCIDDSTRPRFVPNGYRNLPHFIDHELEEFLTGYHRSPQLDQPRHIEVLGEKNTLMQIIRPICGDYYIPMTLGRGYASIPVWRDMADRFRQSGKDAFTLIIASDYDPEGFDLADDAIRSLRDCFGVDVEGHRIAVERDQIDELELAADFNPAKETSSRLRSFVERTGGKATWELEALPPEYLQDQLRAAIEANMNMEIYNASLQQMKEDAKYLASVRDDIAGDLRL